MKYLAAAAACTATVGLFAVSHAQDTKPAASVEENAASPHAETEPKVRDSSSPPAQKQRHAQAEVATAFDAKQLVVVLSKHFNTHRAQLRRFEWREEGWAAVGVIHDLSLGRRGMAWGRGLLAVAELGDVKQAVPAYLTSKKEGDGRSPAGVFRLLSAFGVADSLPAHSQGFPYLATSADSYCVEDQRSAYYNQLIDGSAVESKGWQRWSPLLRSDGLFRWGVVVGHNTEDTQTGAGSCIFLHVWRGAHVGTAGCSAMPYDRVEELVTWLDPALRPTLIQMPQPVYEQLSERFGWPSVVATESASDAAQDSEAASSRSEASAGAVSRTSPSQGQ